jgi:nucleotide-binding universal stress UspA family protein
MNTLKRILCATDLSPHSRNAMDAAIALARDHGAELVLLCVREPAEVIEGEFGMPPPPPEPTDEAMRDRLQALAPDPAINVQIMIARGAPAEEIVRAAKETGCDLIVMGTHDEQDWLGELFHPRVVDEVKRSVTCEVMAVPGAPTATPATL